MEEHLIREIRRRFRRLPASRRVSELREFMAQSEINRKIIEKEFPKFYREAMTGNRTSAFSSSESNHSFELCAKTH
jgi:predicted DNA-binding transcriptional regulator AlpA